MRAVYKLQPACRFILPRLQIVQTGREKSMDGHEFDVHNHVQINERFTIHYSAVSNFFLLLLSKAKLRERNATGEVSTGSKSNMIMLRGRMRSCSRYRRKNC